MPQVEWNWTKRATTIGVEQDLLETYATTQDGHDYLIANYQLGVWFAYQDRKRIGSPYLSLVEAMEACQHSAGQDEVRHRWLTGKVEE